MLERLCVKNIALIEEAEIEFDGKLNILSGETGSGKSVILDSINFVLGSKADKSMIRYGATEASVSAEFSVEGNSRVNGVLEEFDIEPEDTLIISRRLTQEGRGAIKVNGNTVTAAMLKKIASHLVDVHGQSEHFYLLSESNQLSVIDSLCGEKLAALKIELKDLISEKKQIAQRVATLGGSESERAQKLDLLAYQINEIEEADVKIGEIEQLKAKKRLIDNSERVLNAIGAIKGIISDDNGCSDMLSMACRQASPVTDFGEEYEKLYNRLEELSVELSDVSDTVSDMLDDFSFDESEAQRVEERLTLLKALTKKYGTDEEQILLFLKSAKEQFDALDDAAAELEKLAKKSEEIDRKIYGICTKMTDIRKKQCESFCSDIEEQLKTLNIPNAKFFVEFEPYSKEQYSVTADGADKISFMFSANKGEPPKPLNKVISGGEMSRFMLAVKTKLKGLNGISTYIFDEIDAGISGVTAISVAEKFISISKETQIIAVSHLPQVCAAASSQYLITKTDADGDKTVSKIKHLSREERVDEIIRLTGSIDTAAARTHAEELLSRYGN